MNETTIDLNDSPMNAAAMNEPDNEAFDVTDGEATDASTPTDDVLADVLAPRRPALRTIEVDAADVSLVEGLLEDARRARDLVEERTRVAHRAAPGLDPEDVTLWRAYSLRKFGVVRAFDPREALDFSVAREALQIELEESARAADEERETREAEAAESEFSVAEWREELEVRQARLEAAQDALAEVDAARSAAVRELDDARAYVLHAQGVIARLANSEAAELARRQHVRRASVLAGVAATVSERTGCVPSAADAVVRVLGDDIARCCAWVRHAQSRGLHVASPDPFFDAA